MRSALARFLLALTLATTLSLTLGCDRVLEFIEQDRCLDAGGSWNEDAWECIGLDPEPADAT